MTAIERLPNLRDVLEDALTAADSLASPENVDYLLARLEAFASTPAGRLEVAGLLGNAEYLDVTRMAKGEEAHADALLVAMEHAITINPQEGETVVVVCQRRWELM